MKKLFYFLLLASAISMTAIGCSKDDDDPTNPQANVSDPVGTVTENMRNDFSNYGFRINEENNFVGGWIIDLGEMKGLGNITTFTLEGKSNSCAVIPGHGYLVFHTTYNSYYDSYTIDHSSIRRLYVVSYMTDGQGEIIGATVKYQMPFKPSNEVPYGFNSKDDDGPTNPQANVPDPVGTVTVDMRNDDHSGSFYIDDENNFGGTRWVINLGEMKGLGNITRFTLDGVCIPCASVMPGYGYLAFNCDRGEYISPDYYYHIDPSSVRRLYVVSYMTDGQGEIIGATVKYQMPFNPSNGVPNGFFWKW